MMGRKVVQLLLISLAAMLSPRAIANEGASDGTAGARESSQMERDEELFLDAVNDFLNGRLAAARTELQAILGSRPYSGLGKAALVALADSYYIEGGSNNLKDAEAGYREFLLLFPDDRLADAVRIKLADTCIRWMWVRDQAAGLKLAERELEHLIRTSPPSRNRR